MGPKFCENCTHLGPDGSCRPGKTCRKWKAWFSREWELIRIAAGKNNKNNGGVPK